MRRSTNNSEVKKINRNRVFRYINEQKETCMTEIAAALDMSGPTVLSLVNELRDSGMIEEVGEYKSTGGRKAKAIASVKGIRYALGLDITKNHIVIAYTDLTQQVLNYERMYKPFENTAEYFRAVSEEIREFVRQNKIPDERIVGLGISAPVIIDRDRKMISNSHALGIHNVPCENWTTYMPYPSALLNDANAAVLTEWIGKETCESMVYLSLSNTVGGAVVYQSDRGNVYSRDGYLKDVSSMHLGNNWRSGEFGHMVIHPEGRKCYCGKKGCVDAYCSALRLADMEDGILEKFFVHLKEGSEEHKKVWEEYMENLALTVDNLRMIFDMDVVLGGYVGCYMEPYIPELQKRLSELDIFERRGNYVRACGCRSEASAFGSAIYQMEKYIESI